MTRTRWTVLVLTLALVGTTMGTGAAGAETSDRIKLNEDVLCSEPAGSDLAALPELDLGPDDVHPDILWLEDDTVQKELQNIQGVVDADADSVIGSFIDYEEQSLTVVYTPEEPNPERFVVAIKSALDAAPAQVEADRERYVIDPTKLSPGELAVFKLPSEPPPKPDVKPELIVHLRPGCRTAGELRVARTAILERDWHADATEVAFMVRNDVATARLRLVLDAGNPRSQVAAHAAMEQFGDAVVVELGQVPVPLAGSRNNDAQPHFGGAKILVDPGGFDIPCSTGYAMDRGGGRWLSSAAHCAISDWQRVESGSQYVGLTRHRSVDVFWIDAMLIGSGIQTFQRSIYTDPGSPTQRLVDRVKLTSWIGMGVCSSGAVTLAKCSGTTLDIDVPVCVPGSTEDCWELNHAERAGNGVFAQGGDSGGPLYGRHGSTASIRGTMILGNPFAPFDEVWFQDPAEVGLATGSTVATACCNDTSW